MHADRPHTGRRRNEAARLAILEAALGLLASGEGLSVERLAAAAGVGKQTIYRWWPTKAAVVIEAMNHAAELRIPDANTGSLGGDLERFLVAMFTAARDPTVAAALRTLAIEATADPVAKEILRGYATERRKAFRTLVDRAVARGEIARPEDGNLAAEQAFGVVWYRLLISGDATDSRTARRLAHELAAQLTGHRRHASGDLEAAMTTDRERPKRTAEQKSASAT
jgi:AcrR family transcriptional regulator